MGQIDAQRVSQRLRQVVADEPKAFAYDVGISLSALYNYLNGRVPSTEVLFRIALYTGKPMEWFLVADDLAGQASLIATPSNGRPLSVARAA